MRASSLCVKCVFEKSKLSLAATGFDHLLLENNSALPIADVCLFERNCHLPHSCRPLPSGSRDVYVLTHHLLENRIFFT